MTPPPLPPQAEDRPSVSAGFAGVFNAFVDPRATARAVRAPLAWLWPLIVLGAASVLYGFFFFAPLMLKTMRDFPPEGVSGERLEQALHFTEMFAKVGVFIGPLLIAGIMAALAGLVVVTASMLSLRVKFRDVFALMSACSLISTLQIVASYFVLHAKAGEIGSMQQLRPAFGLDIFFSDLKGPLYAILNYFSLFQVWYLVMLALGLAYLAGCSKGKAFMAITPVWLIGLLLAIVGSLFQRT